MTAGCGQGLPWGLSGSRCPSPLSPEPPGAVVSLAGGASGRQRSRESLLRMALCRLWTSAPVRAGELTFSQGVLCVETPLCDTVTTPGSLPMVSMETPITAFPAHLKSRLEITVSPLSYYFLFPSHEHHMSSRNCQKCGFENSRVCFHFYTPQGSFSAFTLNPCKERFSILTIPFLPSFYKGSLYLLSSFLTILLPSGCLIKSTTLTRDDPRDQTGWFA